MVVSLTSRPTDEQLARARGGDFVAVLSSYRFHLGDPAAVAAEQDVLDRLKGTAGRVVVFRPGVVLGAAALRRFGACYPLVPRRLRAGFVTEAELAAAIERERVSGPRGRRRAVSVLGPNRAWRDVLAEHAPRGAVSACVTAVCWLLSWLLLGELVALALRRHSFDTLRPRSLHELRGLCHPANARHVKVVGYNHGVNHFGHSYPARTVVSTVRLNRIRKSAPDRIRADAGATVRQALDVLAATDQTLYVVPNFSYVCLGTAYYVPIHGSAADYSCLAETITKVLLYDPAADRLTAAASNDPAFGEHVYNLRSGAVLMRLEVRVKPRSRYFMNREELTTPDAATILAALTDPKPTNVEVRKPDAAGETATVARFYSDAGGAQAPVLELPRDAIGRLWDRLEENPVTAYLMHTLTRKLAWHVELFFTADEFARFWADHRSLPLKKIQLRFIRRDGFPHSPFRDHDCVSADMFMLRRSRGAFEAYLARTFAVVRSNPGKHSK
ncbi:MAG: FAD-binding protein [Gemmataceae bacterium]